MCPLLFDGSGQPWKKQVERFIFVVIFQSDLGKSTALCEKDFEAKCFALNSVLLFGFFLKWAICRK